jgi:hypothetical protein
MKNSFAMYMSLRHKGVGFKKAYSQSQKSNSHNQRHLSAQLKAFNKHPHHFWAG